jgi:hypothetical protein
MPHFGNLICFVKECEILIEKENVNSLKAYESNFYSQPYLMMSYSSLITTFIRFSEGHVNPLIKNFTNDWKKSLELINQEIMRSFTNFKNGQSILQVNAQMKYFF